MRDKDTQIINETNAYVRDAILAMAEPAYPEFTSKLVPTVDPATIAGVRTPNLKKLAKEFKKDPRCDVYMSSLPHTFLEENIFHTFLINFEKDADRFYEQIEAFLPFVDNWMVSDALRAPAASKKPEILLAKIRGWMASDRIYTQRVGVILMMSYFLNENYRPEQALEVAKIKSDDYYLNMARAWYFATALAKQWESAVRFVEGDLLDEWTRLATIRKACESFRVSAEHKEYLKSLKKAGAAARENVTNIKEEEKKKVKITENPDKEIVKVIREGLRESGGYCPCRRERTPDTKCMCKEFREQIKDPEFEGFCHCMLYYKSLE